MTPDATNAKPGTSGTDRDELQFSNTPNLLTLSRMIAVPAVVGLLYLRHPRGDLAATVLFIIASITDYFDGYLARSRNLVTVYGKLMDPLADKFLVVCTLIALQESGRIPALVVMILVCRELGITALRALASAEGVIIAASQGAKWKTATQMVAIPFLMLKEPYLNLPIFAIGQVLLYFSIGISLWSAKDYVVDFFAALRKRRQARAARRGR